ncbi:MAG: valine--tRNA ligase, partial [Bacteroidales bacterium]|nr:valine--tRNA ligase [Bacteroidales bacterium]
VAGPYDEAFLEQCDLARAAVAGIRAVRAQTQIPPKDALQLCIEGDFLGELKPMLQKLANISAFIPQPDGPAVSFIQGTVKFSIPLSGLVDTQQERAKVLSELEYQRKFLSGVRAKLANPNFVAHAPAAVIANERKKEADALARIEALETSLNQM